MSSFRHQGGGDGTSMNPDENSRIPWELHKENIQPLSHGRKISTLNQSLSAGGGGQPRSDEEIAHQLEQLEEELKQDQGDDPLAIWARCIAFFEQNCLTSGKYQIKYKTLLNNCIRKFLNHDQWKDDKRFVEILIKSFSSQTAEKRVAIIQNALVNQGVGKTVSLMYTQVAEDFEALKRNDRASEILQLGKNNNAQPAELLDEFTRNFQMRVAQAVYRNMKEKAENDENPGPAGQDSRLFGASVPLIGPQHEAQNLRTGLVIADPSRTRPALPGNANEPRRVAVYQQNENDENWKPPTKSQLESVKEIEQNLKDKLDKENFIEPTKWSKPDTAISTTFIPPPPPAGPVQKIQIYEDSERSIVVPPPEVVIRKPRKTTDRAVLGERKIDTEEEVNPKDALTRADELKKTVALIASAPVETVPVNLPAPKVPFGTITEDGQNANVISGLALPVPPANFISQADVAPPLPSNQRMMCRVKDLWHNGRELTFEHLRVAEYKKRKICAQDLIHQTQNIVQAVQSVQGTQKPPQRSESPQSTQPDPRIVQLEMENATLKGHIERLEAQLADMGKRQAEMEQQQIEMQNKLLETEKQAKLEKSRQIEAVLEALQNQSQPREGQNANNFPVAATVNQGKENVFAEPELMRMPIPTHAFTRKSTTFTRQMPEHEITRPLYLPPECDDTEAIMTRQANFQPEFDLSNLTRALNFNPPPIYNSTPERQKVGYDDSGRIFQSRPVPMMVELTDGMDDCGGGDRDCDAINRHSTAPIPAPTLCNPAKANFNATMHVNHNLSTIQENSKESRASNTTSSSGSTANYTKSAQKTGVRSQLATSVASNKSNYQYNPNDWTN